MTYLDFAGLIGTLVLLACAVIGVRQVWGWIQAGYRLDEKHKRLGEACVKEADAVMDDVKVSTFRREMR